MEEYLTVRELSDKIKFSRQSLYNLIHRGTFVLGKHYLKPTPKKILFKWSEILIWLGDDYHSDKEMSHDSNDSIAAPNHSDYSKSIKPASLINI
jgi:hypothetical protein